MIHKQILVCRSTSRNSFRLPFAGYRGKHPYSEVLVEFRDQEVCLLLHLHETQG
jgi:hypothetical protein